MLFVTQDMNSRSPLTLFHIRLALPVINVQISQLKSASPELLGEYRAGIAAEISSFCFFLVCFWLKLFTCFLKFDTYCTINVLIFAKSCKIFADDEHR